MYLELSQPQGRSLVRKTAKIADIFPCSSGHVFRNMKMTNMAGKTEGHILGPMPLKSFLRTFLPRRRNLKENAVSKVRRRNLREKIKGMASCKVEVDVERDTITLTNVNASPSLSSILYK